MKRFFEVLESNETKKGFVFVLFIVVFVFVFLAFKNPFGDRSLVANLEPYPDTLYYSIPAWNFVSGKGFKMETYGEEIKKLVPSGYGIFLIPFFAIFDDIRSFYIANMVLSILTILFFLKIARKIFKKNVIVFLLGFLLVTNFYFYTQPQLLMAENITIFLLTTICYLLVSKLSFKNIFLSVFLSVWIMFVKFSNLPIGVSLFLLMFLKLIREKRIKSKLFLFWVVNSFCFGVLFAFYLLKTDVLSGHQNLSEGSGFSLKYFFDNLSFYFNSFFKKPTRYLWFDKTIFDIFIFVSVLLGILFSFIKKTRLLWLLLIPLVLILFMSFFYYPDIRYIYSTVPLMLLFIGFVYKKIGIFVAGFLFLIYVFVPINGERNIVRWKNQVGLNLFYREDPWNYLSLMEVNKYFDNNSNSYFGSFLPPFYVEMFLKDRVKYLPISSEQEFSSGAKKILDRFYSDDLISYYKKLVDEGENVYISNYYMNNSGSWRQDWESLVFNFELDKVYEACLGSCNLYKLQTKEIDNF